MISQNVSVYDVVTEDHCVLPKIFYCTRLFGCSDLYLWADGRDLEVHCDDLFVCELSIPLLIL